MIKIKDYQTKRQEAILQLLGRSRANFKPAAYEKLILELNKIKALVKLYESCNKDFKKGKVLKPFDILLDETAKVRALQEKEEMLRKFVPASLLKAYRKKIRKNKIDQIQAYFTFINEDLIGKLTKKFQQLEDEAGKLSKKGAHQWLDKRKKKNKKAFKIKAMNAVLIHKMKYVMLAYQVALDSLLEKEDKAVKEKRNKMALALHIFCDYDNMYNNMQEIFDSGYVPKDEFKALEKIKSDLAMRREAAFQSLNILN